MKDHKDMRCTVLGLGGVGGVVGGKLASYYGESITFIARGARGESIRRNGLTVHSDFMGEFTAHPGCVQDTPDGLPVQDLILVCVKNDALEAAALQLRPIVGPDTVVIPVMNGVTAAEKLAELLPQAHVPLCVIYTVSMANADFSITQQGRFTHIFLGAQKKSEAENQICRDICAYMAEAGLDMRYTDIPETEVWTKYIWNCAYNVATARWVCDIGFIKHDPDLLAEYKDLLLEATAVARARGVALPDTLMNKQLDKLAHTSSSATSSLGRDFAEHKKGEMEVFCGDVLRMGTALHIEMPVTKKYYEAMLAMAAEF